jgi:hypothetical protein
MTCIRLTHLNPRSTSDPAWTSSWITLQARSSTRGPGAALGPVRLGARELAERGPGPLPTRGGSGASVISTAGWRRQPRTYYAACSNGASDDQDCPRNAKPTGAAGERLAALGAHRCPDESGRSGKPGQWRSPDRRRSCERPEPKPSRRRGNMLGPTNWLPGSETAKSALPASRGHSAAPARSTGAACVDHLSLRTVGEERLRVAGELGEAMFGAVDARP